MPALGPTPENPYYQDDSRRMLTSFVLFMDFLGMKKMWSSPAAEDISKQLEFVNRYAEKLNELVGPLDSTLSALKPQVVTFSDNVSVTFPIHESATPILQDASSGAPYSRTREEYLSNNSSENALLDYTFDWFIFVNDLADFQLVLTAEGYPLRGAFTFGPVFAESGLIAGPALVEAAEREKSVVQMPFISAPDEILEIRKVDRNGNGGADHSSLDGIFAYTRFRHKDKESRSLFVNYLDCLEAGPHPADGQRNLLIEHRDMIIENLKNVDGEVRPKYVWLARYHNWFCAQYQGAPRGSFDQISIPEDIIAAPSDEIDFMSLQEISQA